MKKVNRLVGGLEFPEGLRWHEDRLWFSDMNACKDKALNLLPQRAQRAQRKAERRKRQKAFKVLTLILSHFPLWQKLLLAVSYCENI
jgi:hypothetical protein